jgi:2-amino-4-hydroxy-6-hydroxymethyldihydropteridine diphosphokinase
VRDAVAAYVGLGANLGDAAAALDAAVESLGALPGTRMGKCSPVYRTAPVGAGGPDYLNAVVELATSLTAPDLMHRLQRIEDAAGRTRPARNAPRTLDLDLLLYGSASIASAQLVVPHPRMEQRAFVLVPLADIAPGLVTAAQLEQVKDQRMTRI